MRFQDALESGKQKTKPGWTISEQVIKISRLSKCSTARGSSTELSLVGPTKAKACKSFLFTECSLKVENKEHLINFVVTLNFAQVIKHNIIRRLMPLGIKANPDMYLP